MKSGKDMKEIDFSCKHNIMLKDPDGNLQPMDEPYFRSKEVAPGTFQCLTDGDAFYVVAGDREAVVIDSGYGAGNVRKFCQALTDKPIHYIINTHHHFDHTANNSYFDKAFMSEKCREQATIPFPSFDGIDFPRDYPIEVIGEGYTFDLGGRTLETFETPDHADSSLSFLDRKGRILFVGDEFMVFGKRMNGTIEHWLGILEKLRAHRFEFDHLCSGFGYLDAEIFDKQYAAVKAIYEGARGEPMEGGMRPHEEEYDSEGHPVYSRLMPHPGDMPKMTAPPKPRLRYVLNGCEITYDPDLVYDDPEKRKSS